MEKENRDRPVTMECVIKKISTWKPYRKKYLDAIDYIWESTVKENEWWSKKDLEDMYLSKVFDQIVHRKESWQRKNYGRRYLSMILSSTQEADEEIQQIISNARSRTKEFYLKEIKKKRKSQSEIDYDFNNAYGHLSLKEQHAIKKGRRSGLNRYKTDFCGKLNVNTPSLGESIDIQLEEMELRDELRNELTEKEYGFMQELEKLSSEEIARVRQIDVASVERKKRRLRAKIREILAS